MAPDGSSPAATNRCRCGRPVELDHQYCPACGTPTSDPDAVAHLDPAGDSLLLLGRQGQAANETRVSTGPGLAPRVIGIGLGVVGLALIWSLFRQPTSEVAPEPGQEEAVADTEPDESADADADDEGDEPDANEDEDAAEADAPTTTRPAASGSTSSDPSGDRGPAIPIVGEETGLRLVIGREGSADLRILDLDSGTIEEVEGVPDRPLGAIGSWVILQRENTGRTSRLDLDDLEAGPVQIGDGTGDYFEVLEITDDRIWGVGETDGGPQLQAVDLDGNVVEEFDYPIYSRFGYGPWSLTRPSALLYDPAGGLYRRTDDGFELIAEGQVLAAGERLAVVRQCDEEFDCQLRWYDIRTSGVIGFPAPPPSVDEGFYLLLGGDRWLAYFDFRTGQGQLIEVATATIARDLNMESFFRYGPSATAVTDDGRWLVESIDGMLTVVDLDDGTEWSTGIRGSAFQTVFVTGQS